MFFYFPGFLGSSLGPHLSLCTRERVFGREEGEESNLALSHSWVWNKGKGDPGLSALKSTCSCFFPQECRGTWWLLGSCSHHQTRRSCRSTLWVLSEHSKKPKQHGNPAQWLTAWHWLCPQYCFPGAVLLDWWATPTLLKIQNIYTFENPLNLTDKKLPGTTNLH